MLPPGLAFVGLSARTEAAMSESNLPKYYFNFADTIKAIKKNDTPFTPAVSLIRGLDVALDLLLQEGMEKVWKRHETVAGWVRGEMVSLGLELFSKAPSNGLTAVIMPPNIASGDVIKIMRDEHQVVMADGQGELKGKIVRFAHMGAACTMEDAKAGMKAFTDAMTKKGYRHSESAAGGRRI
jgi:aspartate aminotransferase-like enzyme